LAAPPPGPAPIPDRREHYSRTTTSGPSSQLEVASADNSSPIQCLSIEGAPCSGTVHEYLKGLFRPVAGFPYNLPSSHSTSIIHHPSSIIHHPSSIILHSSFIHRHSSFFIPHPPSSTLRPPSSIHLHPSLFSLSPIERRDETNIGIRVCITMIPYLERKSNIDYD